MCVCLLFSTSAMSVCLHWFLLRLFLAAADWSRGMKRTSIMLLLVGEREGGERGGERQTVNMEEVRR